MKGREIESAYTLSPMQQGMFFHSVYAEGSGLYVQQIVCRLREDLNVPAFERAWRRVVGRHPVLRTGLRWADLAVPVQEVHPHVELPLTQSDWRGRSTPGPEERLEAYLAADRERGFELTEAPLMRLLLARVADAEYWLVWSSHHLLMDGRARLTLFKELFALYEADLRGEDLEPERPRPFRDYIEWMKGFDLSAAEEFWRPRLKGLAAPTSLVRSRHVAREPHEYGELEASLSEADTSALRSLAKQHGLTLNTIVQGAWALLLSRYSGEEDVVFGATRTCRRNSVPGAEGMVGLLINTLPLRVRAPRRSPLLPWLKELRAENVALRGYEHTPLIKIQEWSELPNGVPLFESLLVFENYRMNTELRSQGGSWSGREFRVVERTNYPLTVSAYAYPQLTFKVSYDRQYFDHETVARLTGHLLTLLESIAADPDRRLSELPMLSAAELREILFDWNQTAGEYPSHSCLNELFEARAAESPGAPALFHEGGEVSYGELNERANRLAHLLRHRGVGPESRVGVLLPRTPELVVALLAILKAGGAYVPLDPRYPEERLRFMLEDSGAALVLTQESLLADLPGLGGRALCLDSERDAVSRRPGENPAPLAVPENLAYVIYTSGSTGRPKGVAIEHRNAAALVGWARGRYSPEELSGVLASTSVCFDLSVFELFAPLSSGGAAVLVEDALALCGLKSAGRVRLVNTVPSAMSELLRLGCLPRSARTVNLAGEPLSAALVGRVYEAGAERVYDLYGPTEDTTYSTCALRESEGAATVGRPLSNRRLYILDADMRPVPVGVEGEVYLGGAGVTRGYLGRPSLTAERYVPDSLSGVPGARLYRTGDLARYLDDGRLVYAGRRDQQVKLRGFRIELGEVEAALTTHPEVGEAAALVREDSPGDPRLTAYVVGAPGRPSPDPDSLRDHLRRRLPEYMVPAAFVTLDALPLTPNGKVDRRALPAPGPGGAKTKRGYVAPSTPSERLMTELWAEVLRAGRVGMADNFFDAGGHSLLATQLISRLAGAFGVELPIRALFEHLTPAALCAYVDECQKAGQRVDSAPLVRAERGGDELPLSFAQQRLWFLDQLEPGGAAYNMYAGMRLEGRLDAAALGRALGAVVERHEVLRTTFEVRDGRPVQVVGAGGRVGLAVVDLRGQEGGEAEALRQAGEEARAPFDLRRGPLLRARLWRLSEDEHVLLLTMHHIASDGWSLGVLLRELGALYTAYAAGRPSPLPELPVQYADYAVWQREHLRGAVLDGQLAYWKRQLAGAPAELELPLDRPRPAAPTYRGGRHRFTLSGELTEGLRRLGREEGATLFMTLLAGWQALLSRYSRQPEVVVGTPVAGRTRVETEGLIGFFVNTLVLRTDLSGEPSFRELVGRVREVCLGAYAHQEVPFEKLVEELQPERSLSRTPLFQVMFVMNVPGSLLELEGVEARGVEVSGETAKFDLTLNVTETEEGLACSLKYSTDLFEAGTAERLAQGFEALLTGAAAEPEAAVTELPVMSERELGRVVRVWNETAVEYPSRSCLHELFERRAAEGPDAPALIYEGGEVSYGELNERANRLAHYLRRVGVAPETAVGVCMERGPEMFVAALGVLKAGGAYLPLDPEYPAERLDYMLRDAGVKVLLTQRHLTGRLQDGPAQLIALDDDGGAPFAREEAENPQRVVSDDNLAYVIYTSGSTGRPKGVMVSHRAIRNHLLWRQATYPLGETDRFLQKASFSFDISVWEIFGTLAAGAALVVARPGGQRDADYLVSLMAERRVTVAHFSPAALEALLAEPGVRDCHSLSRVFCGGDVLSAELQERFFALLNARLHYQYGPTETTVDVTCRDCEPGDVGRRPPIGRPIANTQAYILDRALQPVPVGVAGELFIGGECLARGYYNGPDLTAEKFVPNPFGAAPGSRLYRTGDLARHLPDGEIEFLGRADQQVKLRGYRIELPEIELAVGGHPSVRRAVAAVTGEGAGKRLVAYVEAEQGQSPAADELRRHAAATLPEYMVPQLFVSLPELPLTPTGKIDRRALPAPERLRQEPTDLYVAPRGGTEEVLAELWRELLPGRAVGVHDNFFELGGHSLSASRLVARVRHLFGIELPLRSLFEEPTVAGLAERIERVMRAGVAAEGAPLRPVDRGGELPASFAQERLWFLEQLEPGSGAYSVPVGIRLSGHLDAAAVGLALNEVVRRHEVLRTTFAVRDGQPVQVISPPRPVEPTRLDLRHLQEGARSDVLHALLRRELEQPFHLAEGPLLRVQLLRFGEEDHLLLLTMHHIVSDGWTVGVLLKELGALYSAYASGLPSPLAELPVQYADFAVWQRENLRGPLMAEQLAYWKRQLAGAPASLELPTDRPRPPKNTSGGARHYFTLPEELMEGLRRLGREEGATLFMTLLAGWQALLSRYSRQPEVVVGTPVAGRTRVETEGLIGFFVNTLVMRTDLSGEPSFRELVGRVREVCLGAYAHQEVPFEKLVEELRPERSLSRTPLFQVMFALQNTPREVARGGELSMRAEALETGRAKFDLTLVAEEIDGGGLRAMLSYRTDLFDAETIARMAGHYRRLLESAARTPETVVSRAELLDEEERRLLLDEWNRTHAEAPAARSVHELFERRAAERPGAAAIVFEGREVSYGELNERAERIARRLRERGVRAEATVGVLLERSPEMVAAMLGVLKAGGAYVPLDSEYPEARLRQMAEDAGVAVVLTRAEWVARVKGWGVDALTVEEAAEEPRGVDGAEALTEDRERAGGENLAYVIYTSGSTGRPKGVMVSHDSLLNLIDWHQRSYDVTPDDRATQVASVSFDASVWEVWPYLAAGAAVHIVDSQTRLDARRLLSWLADNSITVSFLPTPLAESVLAEPMPPGLVLRALLTGGDRLHGVGGDAPPFAFVNHYGPTESCVVTTAATVGGGERENPPIGRPIANTRVYILDARMQPVPVGVIGELYVGGRGLARGYLGRPGLTAESFVPDPFGRGVGQRLYRTGDLARFRADGNVEFVGRGDQQVKVRGHRIELGEIESVLGQHAGVSACAAAAQDGVRGQKTVVAYFVARDGSAPAAAELRRHLEERLPAYMVPSGFVELGHMPLTENGKLDRAALQALGPASMFATTEYVAPQNAEQEAMAGIWRGLLGVERVGIFDDFFELGGHSLLSVRLVSRIYAAFDVEVPIQSLFETPTVAGLTEKVQAARWAAEGARPSGDGAVSLREVGEL